MDGYRSIKLKDDDGYVPQPINIDELIEFRKFPGTLLHFTQKQWKYTLSELKPTKKIPEDAVRFVAWEMPGDLSRFGVLGSPFFRCPPNCTPIGGRGLVCPEPYGPVGYTPDPDCWFEPQCRCDPDISVPGAGSPGIPDCSNDNCELRLVPLRIDYRDAFATILRFECIKTGGDCKHCVMGVSQVNNMWLIGCICEC